MMLGSIYRKVRRWSAYVLLTGSGTVLAVPGCDAEVSNLLVNGFESAASTAATSIIQAIFETVTRETDSVTNVIDAVPVVLLDTVQQVATMLT